MRPIRNNRSDRHAPGAIHYKANTMAAAMWRAQPNAPDLLSLSLFLVPPLF